MAGRHSYIAEIDSLRAFAVLGVVLFHVWPHGVPGGFIGVDIFFVISGFVIARSYLFDLLSGRKRLAEFYLARFRRLAPALVVVMAVTALGSLLVLEPDRLAAFGRSLAVQPVWMQNFVFWSEGDYFSYALTKPLLHTWSLAVEEQFYLLWAGLILVLRRFPRAIWALLVAGIVISISAGILIEPRSPKTAFYLVPTRIWEFAFGIMAYLAVHDRAPIKGKFSGLAVGISVALVAILLVCFLAFGEEDAFPGLHAALACVSTAILLGVSQLVTGSRGLGWLRFAPLVYVGRISYGLYLWHWPPLALFYVSTGAAAGLVPGIAIVAFSFAAAAISFHLLEAPVQRREVLATNRSILSFVGLSSLAMIAVGGLFLGSGGLMFRYPPAIQLFLAAPEQHGPFRCGKIYALLHPSAQTCRLSGTQRDGDVLILGDSHADVLKEMLTEAGKKTGRGIHLAVRNCDLGSFGSYSFCSRATLSRLLSEAQENGVDRVVAISLWDAGKFDADTMAADISDIVGRGMSLTIMRRVPGDESYNPVERARAALGGAPLDYGGISLDRYIAANRDIDDRIDAAVSRFPSDRVRVFSPAAIFCPNGQCIYAEKGVPLYSDNTHLTFTGAKVLQPAFEALFDEP